MQVYQELVRPFHPRSKDSQCQERFLVSSVYKKTRKYDTECLNHHPTQLPQCTGIEL